MDAVGLKTIHFRIRYGTTQEYNTYSPIMVVSISPVITLC